jgi:hypothetical protein
MRHTAEKRKENIFNKKHNEFEKRLDESIKSINIKDNASNISEIN